MEKADGQMFQSSLNDADRAFSQQLYYYLVMFCLAEWDPKLKTRHVDLLFPVLSFRFDGDIQSKISAFEAAIEEYQDQTRKTIEGDIICVACILGLYDKEVEDHCINSIARLDTWPRMREELMEITRTKKYLDSLLVPMDIGAFPKKKGKGDREGQHNGKNQARTKPPKPKPPHKRTQINRIWTKNVTIAERRDI